jgi:hypothetical protein
MRTWPAVSRAPVRALTAVLQMQDRRFVAEPAYRKAAKIAPANGARQVRDQAQP